jgi:hypothetical protein
MVARLAGARRCWFFFGSLWLVLPPWAASAQQSGEVVVADPNEPAIRAKAGPEPPMQKPKEDGAVDYDTPRVEVAGSPLIGGNSDIGVEFGGVGTLTRFADGIVPFRWNVDLVLAASVKNGPQGAEIAQQNYLLQVDVPDLVPEYLRFTITTSYQRTVDQGYFGLGNASSSTIPGDTTGERGRFFQFIMREALARSLTRVVLKDPYALLIGFNLRYVEPSAYADSRLARDFAARDVRGLRALGSAALALGIGYDTRDNEFFPHRGAFHQVGFKANYALPAEASIQYGSFGAVLAGYMPLGGPWVLAGRAVVDAQFGHVPFYDLASGNTFHPDALPGGPSGVRGVPIGRYLGLLKMLANIELRALLLPFELFGGHFHLGGNVFADTGRVFREYRFDRALDGTGIGLKWGAGAGVYLQWGQAAIFRVEAAYSPDAVAVNHKFPLGVYVNEGVMF